MIDRRSALGIALTLLAIGALISLGYRSEIGTIFILSTAATLGMLVLYSGNVSRLDEPVIPAPTPHDPLFSSRSLLHHPDFALWLDQEDEPVIGISDNIVTIANSAAIGLLGRHIIGADIRTAIRHPAAAELFHQPVNPLATTLHGQVSLFDYPRTGQHWVARLKALSRGDAILFLNDRSAIDAADRMRSDFVANASHELRTPLASILGYVETLQDMDDAPPPLRSRFLSVIEREAQRMHQLVLDLLSISRVEADRFRRPNTVINLTEIIRTSVSDVQDGLNARSTDIVSQLPETPIHILADAVQLSQLVQNIIANAMKYGRAGSPITVVLVQQQQRAILTIRDRGEGIAAEHIPRLTERFYRVDDARSRSVGGTGLGLSIVKHITERHQGQLDITSVVGEGTTVRVSFPITNAPH